MQGFLIDKPLELQTAAERRETMTQKERQTYLLDYLISEINPPEAIIIPQDDNERKRLLRSFVNIRAPKPIPGEFIRIENHYLQEEQKKEHITSLKELTPIASHLYLWQGDITTLQVDGIVNAANSALLGCFVPCHSCIDNAIHSKAGVALRLACADIMNEQGTPEPTGQAKITSAYNLPCKYVIHTVGPIIHGSVTEKDCQLLADCYRSCLALAVAHGLQSIAFCCISTGEFHFPNEKAAAIAVQTVRSFLATSQVQLEVIFNVFKDDDYQLYQQILKAN